MGLLNVFCTIQRWLGRRDMPVAPDQPAPDRPEAVTQAEIVAPTLAALEKQLARVGREQLKANALVETQAERWTEALEALRTADQRRSAELVSLREQAQAAQAQARLELIRTLLPALDGLDEALRVGSLTLAQPPAAPAPGFWERLRGDQPAPPDALLATMAAWLAGIDLVRQRFLEVLAAEGIQPMAAQGEPFDPHRHVAIAVVPADSAYPPGTVASELRRGYRQGDRVVRLAEVVVAKQMNKH